MFWRKKRELIAADGLMNHVLSLTGGANFNPKRIGIGTMCRRVSWDGCMATERNEGPEGPVVRVGVKSRHCGDMLGIIVRYPDHERWEPFQHLRMVDGKLECWT